MKITVAYNKFTNKIIPFETNKYGEIILLEAVDENAVIISSVDSEKVDFYDGYLIKEELDGEKV